MRGYPLKLLNSHYLRLSKIDRLQLLKPKSKLLINYLSVHNPEILLRYNNCTTNNIMPVSVANDTFIIFPFYKIPDMKNLILRYFYSKLSNYFNGQNLKNHINIKMGFSIPNSLEKITRNAQ